jgi:hypothetical protein
MSRTRSLSRSRSLALSCSRSLTLTHSSRRHTALTASRCHAPSNTRCRSWAVLLVFRRTLTAAGTTPPTAASRAQRCVAVRWRRDAYTHGASNGTCFTGGLTVTLSPMPYVVAMQGAKCNGASDCASGVCEVPPHRGSGEAGSSSLRRRLDEDDDQRRCMPGAAVRWLLL